MKEKAYSKGEQRGVSCYGADDVREGVAIMHLEGVDVAITGNSTNPTRFQHPVVGIYKKECLLAGKNFSPSPPGRNRKNTSSGQHGCRTRFLRHDRHDGKDAFRRAVCRFIVRSRPCGNDGLDRHGQQPDGGRIGCGCCGPGGSHGMNGY